MKLLGSNGLFGSLEREESREEQRRGERSRGEENSGEERVEGDDYPPPCLDVFKISKGEESNQPFLLFGCFKNQDENERK